MNKSLTFSLGHKKNEIPRTLKIPPEEAAADVILDDDDDARAPMDRSQLKQLLLRLPPANFVPDSLALFGDFFPPPLKEEEDAAAASFDLHYFSTLRLICCGKKKQKKSFR